MNVIIKPLITEKTMQEANKGRFTFQVSLDAAKPAIKDAVEKAFAVTVVNITTSVIKGRKTRRGTRRVHTDLRPWKKAAVTLKEGQKIALFELGK